MSINEETLKNIIHSPAYIQSYILSDLASEETKDISNNSTPFSTILETISVTTSALANECKNVMRTKFPILADTMDDLFPHLTDEEIINIYSTPSEARFRISIYAMSLIDFGYVDPKDPNFKQAKIPMGTKITVNNTVFTIINPILVKIHMETKSPYAAMLPTDNPLGYSNIGNLNAVLTHDHANNPYITFEIPIKQITIGSTTSDSVLSNGYHSSFTLSDKYCYSQVYGTRQDSDGKVSRYLISQVYNTEYLDPSVPKAYVNVGDKTVDFSISSIYTKSEMVKGDVLFIVYETKGDIFLPLENNYKPENYFVSLPDKINSSDPLASVATSLKIIAYGLGTATGGTNAITVDELKNKLIYNTTGPMDKPVTQYHIDELAKTHGYSIKLVEDLLTHRTYAAYKDLPSIDVQSIKAIPDIFINTVKLTLDQLKSLYPNSVKKDSSVIRSNTVFRENNGKMILVNTNDLKQILGSSALTRNNYFKENKHFYNPFTVVIENENGYTSSRFYSLDVPKINSLRIETKNLNVININTNINGYSIKRLDKGYRLMVEIKGDSGFEDLAMKHKKVYFALNLSENKIAYEATYNSDYNFWYVDFQFDDFVNSDDLLIVTNYTETGTEYLCPLTTNVTVYTCITEPSNYDEFKTLIEELDALKVNTRDLTILSKDHINVTFGKRLNYIWNKLYNTYDSRKFRRYQEDVYLTYENNVYKKDQYGNTEFTISSDKSTLQTILLHAKGDYVLDENGEKIIKHKQGDVVLDSNGEPIIDTMADLVRFIDIIMLEYEFKLSDELTYKRMMELMMDYFNTMITSELPNINQNLLEKTNIVYMPNKSSEPVSIVSDNIKQLVPYIVTPKITIYIDKSLTVSVNDKELYKQKIGNIIISKLKEKTIRLSDIKNEIINSLDISIIGVKIEGLSPNNSEVINIDEGSNQLTLGKLVTITEYKTNIVTYDLEIDFIRLN